MIVSVFVMVIIFIMVVIMVMVMILVIFFLDLIDKPDMENASSDPTCVEEEEEFVPDLPQEDEEVAASSCTYFSITFQKYLHVCMCMESLQTPKEMPFYKKHRDLFSQTDHIFRSIYTVV